MSDETQGNGPSQPDESQQGDPQMPAEMIPPAQPATTSAAPKIAIALSVVVALAAGVTIFALRSSSSGGVLDKHVPADVVAFGRASLRPDAGQRAAIEAVLDRLSGDQRLRLEQSIDDGLETGFADKGVSWASDIKPWIGSEIGFVIPTISATDLVGGGPNVIALLSVRDEGAARAALRDRGEGTDAFEIVDGVAYLSQSASSLSAFVARAGTDPPLSDDPEYQAAVDQLGRGVGFLWADASSLGALGGALPAVPTGTFAMAARVTDSGFEIEGRAFGEQSLEQPSGGAPELLEGTSASLMASLTFFDVGSWLEDVAAALPAIPGIRPREVLGPFNQLGLDPIDDLAPWLHGEFSIVLGGFATGGFPQVGAIIESTDDEALDRTLEGLRENAARLGRSFGFDVEANETGRGLSIASMGFGGFIVREPGKVAIGSTPDYAADLLAGASDELGGDAVYRASLGESGSETVFQAFVRLDRIRDLVLAFILAEDRAQYDSTAGPLVGLLESAGLRVSTENGGTFLLRVTLVDG
jgi:hypothetical protein